MLDPMEPRAARRAARRAQLRRQRMLAVAGAVVVLAALAVVAVVAFAQGGGSSTRAPAPPPSATATAPPTQGTAGSPGLRASTVKPKPGLDAIGNARIQRLAKLGLPIYCAGPRGNAVAFTFDDGPGPYTHYALKKLTQAGERATFFVVARSMGYFPGWLPREMKVAAIGDHTATHPVLTSLSPDEIASQISTTRQKITAETGQPVHLFRPPYGATNSAVHAIAKRLGMLEILWTIDSGDSLGANWAGIIRNVEAGLHPGAIILMHENRGQTIRALTTLLPELHRRHLRSVSLPELFATDPPSVAQVKRGQLGCGQQVKTAATGT